LNPRVAIVSRVITEHAVLPVRPGQESEFEEAFSVAKPIILGSPGCESLTLSRCLEQPNAYLLLVQWRELDDHVVGFRQSAAYQEWRALLHHFYEPFPVVEHFQLVQSG
jgi:heme-degrading monooxygenase HmoA